ncbi:hypothetical protein [Paraburkholderia azotifigens]|uniref:hypothetical protein n=1 Tax=Paraburkholderia azotifigens TaxID=2057004 RepID=UPI0038B6F88D
MTDDEALRIGRQAAEDAQRKVGGNKDDLLKELKKQSEQQQDVAEAFKKAGMLWQQSHQETKH